MSRRTRRHSRSARVGSQVAFATGAGGMAALPHAVRLRRLPRQQRTRRQRPSESSPSFAPSMNAVSRGVWPGFDASAIPVALFDGERTVLLRHPRRRRSFRRCLDAPAPLIAKGRHPAVTATRRARLAASERHGDRDADPVGRAHDAGRRGRGVPCLLAGPHPAFRRTSWARYVYPLDDVENLGRLVAEDEALARALESRSSLETPMGSCRARGRRPRVAALADDVRTYENDRWR